jgi:nucleoside-diphosphate-sugar epimerase
MRVFLLGATGTIGSAVLRELVGRGHEVFALARSDASAGKIERQQAAVVRGNIETPETWMASLPAVDGVIHMASDFGSAMEAIDRHLLDRLLARLAAQPNKARFLYTGGYWLFGPTGEGPATEETPFSPLAAFAWMVPHLQRGLDSGAVEGIVVHPAMVHGGDGGVFCRFARDAAEGRPVRVVGSEECAGRWSIATILPGSTPWSLKARRPARAGSAWPSRAFPSGELPELSLRTSRSSLPTRSPPSWAIGRGATPATSG